MNTFKIVILLLAGLPVCFKAQNSHPWRMQQQNKVAAVFTFNSKSSSLPPTTKSVCLVKCEAPHLAFFCDMENKFRNRFKVYLKLRAGNDDMYREMIK